MGAEPVHEAWAPAEHTFVGLGEGSGIQGSQAQMTAPQHPGARRSHGGMTSHSRTSLCPTFWLLQGLEEGIS